MEFDTCWVDVEWFGEWRTVSTLVGEGDALIGMKLLEGSDLHIRVTPGGEVRIEPT